MKESVCDSQPASLPRSRLREVVNGWISSLHRSSQDPGPIAQPGGSEGFKRWIEEYESRNRAMCSPEARQGRG